MNWEDRAAETALAVRREEAAAAEGAMFGPQLLRRPPSEWRRLMRSDPRYRSYGTLKYLLGRAREKFENEPTLAHEITAAVLAFVDRVEGPSPVHATGLRGLAWKEHANALQGIGDLREALRAAQQSVRVYGESSTLHFDQTKARLAECNIYREMGESEKALATARTCKAIFVDYKNNEYRLMATLSEAHVLFTMKRFREALALYTDIVEEVERQGDQLTLARGLLNAAECARELGDIAAARDLYPRALAHFETFDLPSETTRVRWGHALTLAAEGKIASAISELFIVQGKYLALGMNAHAASAAMDVVRIRFERHQNVRELCSRLVATFCDAGMMQNAIEALAYLREEASRDTLTSSKIDSLRTYFGELANRPALLFARPSDEEEV